ncbi:MAG: FG-GAP-like repeat-containing protein, partial [Deltaproteobacteria bacterium]|nr:FG-GAP-like repeat-containing protein [Deltaproteobacteria bacterium]
MTRPYISSGFALYAGTLVILAGCTDPAPGVDASTADAPVSADAPVATDASASQLVGPSGGVIFVAGLTLTIPPGAVAAPVAITVTRTDLPAPAGYVGYSPVWRFAPEGLTFARPVTVDLTFNGDAARAGLYWSSAGGYERLTASIAGDRVVGSTSHFSLGFVGDLLALDAGLSDAATDQPADVLPDASAPPDGSALDGGTPSDGGATVDAPDVPTTPAVAAPRPIAPLTGSHVPSRRPMLRWALPAGVMTARVTLCRDRALTASCVSFDAAGTTGAPAADLAPGIWYWALRGVVGGAAGGSLGPVWRLRVATATVAGARPWGSDLDVNGDGFADVLAGVRDLAVSVFPGGVAGPSTTPVVRVAPLDSTHFGQAVDVAGDVNGDGYGDFVVGSPGSNAFYVYLGSATGPAATPSVVTGPVGSGLGSSVTGAGDVNGDGFDDVVAVNPSGNAVWLLPGGASGPGTPTRVTVAATSTASVVSGAGDVDGDGYADVLLAGTANVSGQLLRGAATGLDAARAVAVDRTSAPAGDVYGDGRGDLAFSDAAGARL